MNKAKPVEGSQRKVAVITGASRGIGAATAQRLATDGYDLCINFNSDEKAANEVVLQARNHGVRAIAVQANIASESDVARLFNTVDIELGTPQALINNAGILFQQCRVSEMSANRINQILTTNVTGYFLCCKEAVLRMSSRQGGSGGTIVNVSSAASRLGAAGEYVDYAASKGAIDTLTVGLAKEVADEGIRVNCVRPGQIYTDMHASGGESDRVDRVKNSVPMQRGGLPDEVAAAIAWLVSDESAYTTGSFIEVSGGR
jgi:NAD(P)-dependent dehydrogenase (short-subunit alcohol dehydrogenase family)